MQVKCKQFCSTAHSVDTGMILSSMQQRLIPLELWRSPVLSWLQAWLADCIRQAHGRLTVHRHSVPTSKKTALPWIDYQDEPVEGNHHWGSSLAGCYASSPSFGPLTLNMTALRAFESCVKSTLHNFPQKCAFSSSDVKTLEMENVAVYCRIRPSV